MMKKLIFSTLGMLSLFSTQVFGQAAVGSIAPDRVLSTFDNATSLDLTQTNLRSYEGKVVVLFYYAAW